MGLIAAICSLPALAAGQCDQWLPGGPVAGASDVVRAITTWDPDGPGSQPELLVIGGLFRAVADVPVERVAAWDGAQWTALGTEINSAASALAVYGGELIVGGAFRAAAGSGGPSFIARWNGTQWVALGGGVNRDVHALTVFNGELIAAGEFTTAAGQTARRIARWNGTQWAALGTGMTSGAVYALTVHNGSLFAAGSFTSAGGTAAQNIARWDGTTWHAVGSGLNDAVYALASFQGEIFAGGMFSVFQGGENHRGLARFNGAAWQAAATDGILRYAYGFTVAADSLIVAGDFPSIDGAASSGIARWDGSQWHALGSGVTGTGYAVATYGSAVVVGGDFQSAGSVPALNLATWSGTEWTSFSSGLNGPTGPFAVYSGQILASGQFTHLVQPDSSGIAALSAGTWVPFARLDGDKPRAYALTPFEDDVVIAGRFTGVEGIPASNIARWDGSQWSAMGSGLSGPATMMAADGPTLVVAEDQSPAPGVYATQIVQWNGAAWDPLGPAFDEHLRVLAATEFGTLVLYNTSQPGDNVAVRWNGTSWAPLGSGLLGGPEALAVFRGEVYVGGSNLTLNGTPVSLVRWDGAQWQPVPGILSNVRNLHVYNDRLVAATSEFRLTAWDGTQWTDLGVSIPSLNRPDMATFEGDLVLGGSFTRIGPDVSAFFARYRGHTAINEHPADTTALVGNTATLSVLADGPGLAYQWRRESIPLTDGPTPSGATISGATTPTLQIANIQRDDAGSYDCVITGPCGNATSAPAEVLVFCTADFNHDGSVNSADFDLFNSAFDTAAPTTDLNGDGFVDGIDSDLFHNAFASGC